MGSTHPFDSSCLVHIFVNTVTPRLSRPLTTSILAITGLMKHSIYSKYLAYQDFNDWRTFVGPNHPDKQGLTVTEKFYIPKFMYINYI